MFYGLTPDQERELAAALQVVTRLYPRYFAMDMLVTVGRNMGFLEDAAFMQAVNDEARNNQDRSLLWRLHVLCWCGWNALRLQGDFVECGVFRGFSSAVVARYLRFADQQRTWYLYDTFSGIPQDQLNRDNPSPESYATPGLYESVRERFAPFPNVRVVRGRIPQVLSEVSPASVAYLHLDLNSAAAELGALEQLYDKVVPGGCIVLDDYGWYPYRQQKDEEDPFFAARGTRVLELPTGQGLVVKPPA